MNVPDHHTATPDAVVEVFCTNVSSEADAGRVLEHLSAKWPDLQINFDLEDCDHILRVASSEGQFDLESMIREVQNLGHSLHLLE